MASIDLVKYMVCLDDVLLFLVFFLAGVVKGVIGLGLPTVCLALLSLLFDLTSAMMLLLAPSLATNIWQAFVGGHARRLIQRFWVFFFAATMMVYVGGYALDGIERSYLSGLLGGLLVIYALVGLKGWLLPASIAKAPRMGLVFGGVNGLFTGMTGAFVMPGVLYLQGLALPRDALIQAMGILFTLSTLALAMSLEGHLGIDEQLGGLSMLGVLPAILGMLAGKQIRQRLSPQHFRQCFFFGLLVMGGYIAWRAIVV